MFAEAPGRMKRRNIYIKTHWDRKKRGKTTARLDPFLHLLYHIWKNDKYKSSFQKVLRYLL